MASLPFFHRPDLLPAFFLSALTLLACQSPDTYPVSQGEPDPTLDLYLAQDTAEFLCQYSRGSFPNWHQWRQYSQYLAAEERNAIRDISENFLEHVAPGKRPKVLAVSRFIANHTTCRIFDDEDRRIRIHEPSGVVGFHFTQTYPFIPNIPEITVNPDWNADEAELEWVRAFENAFDGKTIQREITIVLEPGETRGYQLRSNVQDSYSMPIKAQNFWNRLDANQLDDAEEIAMAACLQQNSLCRDLHPYITAAQKFRAAQQEQFNRDVEILDQKLTLVSMAGTNAYTAASITLKNNGLKDYSHIILTTDEVSAQHCELQSERTKKDDHPVTLSAGQTIKAWCALRAETPPWTRLSFYIAD